MAAKMIVEIPDSIQERIDNLARDNFYLWMFIAQQELWEDARDFLKDNREMAGNFDVWSGSDTAYMDDLPPF